MTTIIDIEHETTVDDGIAERVRTVLATLAPDLDIAEDDGLRQLAEVLSRCDAAECWLFLALVRADFPSENVVREALRTIRLDGAEVLITKAFSPM